MPIYYLSKYITVYSSYRTVVQQSEVYIMYPNKSDTMWNRGCYWCSTKPL